MPTSTNEDSRHPNVESREYYDKLAQEYHYSESYRRRPWAEYFHITRRVGEIVASLENISNNFTIHSAADIGCGDGVLLPFISMAARKVTAMDISPERLRMAEEAGKGLSNIDYAVADIMSNSSDFHEKFDLVVCSEVIEHVRDYATFFDNLAEMIAPGGYLILSTPSKWSFREKTLRLQQIILNFYFNTIQKRNLSRFTFYHIGLHGPKKLASMTEKRFSSYDLKTVGLYFPVFTELGFKLGGERFKQRYLTIDERVGKSNLAWINWTQILTARK